MKKMKLAIFASGTGTNAISIVNYFSKSTQISISFILSNKADASIIDKAREKGIKTYVFDNLTFEEGNSIIDCCRKEEIDYIILAGFLRKIPSNLISNYPKNILNIHPSLLPKYGGKGMYGKFVHEEVLKNKEKTSGITIHLVNEEFDKGKIIAQFETDIRDLKSVEELDNAIRLLEHKHFAPVIEGYVLTNN